MTFEEWKSNWDRSHLDSEPTIVNAWHAGRASRDAETAELKRQLRERDFPAIDALRILYEETADYIRINNLGDVHHNRSMQYARDVLAVDTRTLDAYVQEKVDRAVLAEHDLTCSFCAGRCGLHDENRCKHGAELAANRAKVKA